MLLTAAGYSRPYPRSQRSRCPGRRTQRIACLLCVVALVGAGTVRSVAQELGDYSDRPVELTPAGVSQVAKTDVQVFGVSKVSPAFNGVVFRARSDAETPEAWIRLVTATSTGEWLPMKILRGKESPLFFAAYHGDVVVSGGGFEVAIAPAGSEVEILSAGVFDTRLDEDRQEVDWDPALSKKTHVSGKIIPPRLHTRKEWGAAPFIGTPIALARPSYDLMTFHHAACCGAYTLNEGLAQLKAIQDFHQNGRGWSDIGYHFVLDQSGRVYQGRPFLDESIKFKDGPPLALGAHVGGFNTGNIGVSVLGCYHPPEGGGCRDMLSPAALDSLITLFAFLSETYGIPPSTIRGHRDFSSTACPGDNNYALLPEIRRRVAELLVTGNRPVGTASLNAVVNADGVVNLEWQFLTDRGITSFTVERVTPDGRTVLFSGEAAQDMTLTDDAVPTTGEVRYVLSAGNADGRVQELASIRVEIERPDQFVLSNPFPNPSSQSATIRYFLAQDGFVNLRVFDASGRLVDVLQDTFLEKGRWYTVHLNVSDLPSGHYFYRITVEGFAGVVFDRGASLVVAH